MNKQLPKRISYFLICILLITFFTTIYFPINAFSADLYSYEDRREEESAEDAKKLKSITGDWNRAKNKGDVPPYAHFHKDVQEHIRDKVLYLGGNNIELEHDVIFLPGKIPTGNKGNKGRADIYQEQMAKYGFFWEVKPGSYLTDAKLPDYFTFRKTSIRNKENGNPHQGTHQFARGTHLQMAT